MKFLICKYSCVEHMNKRGLLYKIANLNGANVARVLELLVEPFQ